jgi:hypothetical protein
VFLTALPRETPLRADGQDHPPDKPVAADELCEEQVQQAIETARDRSQIDPP